MAGPRGYFSNSRHGAGVCGVGRLGRDSFQRLDDEITYGPTAGGESTKPIYRSPLRYARHWPRNWSLDRLNSAVVTSSSGFACIMPM